MPIPIELGIFAKTFVRLALTEVLDAIVANGLRHTQFNMACAGLPSMPDQLDPALVKSIRREFNARGLNMAALSGTFNMIHPDPAQREKGLQRLAVLAASCADLGTSIITLCTGTRDPENMWRAHPDNLTPSAWDDLLRAMESALKMADKYDITLGVEPEPANVIDRPAKARRLLDALQSPRLKIVMDGANLFHKGDLARMSEVLDDAFAQLGPDIALAHAKDLLADGEAGTVAAGKGKLDYDHYLALLHKSGYNGPLIMHGLGENEVPESIAFLRARLERL